MTIQQLVTKQLPIDLNTIWEISQTLYLLVSLDTIFQILRQYSQTAFIELIGRQRCFRQNMV